MVRQIAAATSKFSTPSTTNSTGSVAPRLCITATTTVEPVMNAALRMLTAAMVRARNAAPAQA